MMQVMYINIAETHVEEIRRRFSKNLLIWPKFSHKQRKSVLLDFSFCYGGKAGAGAKVKMKVEDRSPESGRL